ncbi:MAG: hypothetical protein KatS3mg114_1013 [Planctomycetaceae bacterium]|nr:MAG: hypothetical protein KatS3mg114_1013 [Planctomycetaceae bacterium]
MIMRVLLNATNLVKGGALQVAASLIAEIMQDPQDWEWILAVSPAVLENVERLCEHLPETYHIFPHSPARERAARQQLSELASTVAADVVFTVFGPTYVKFPQPHLMGCASPWVTNATRLAYNTLPTWRERWRMRLWSWYTGRWLRAADAWVTETEASRQGMCRRLGLPARRIAVVPNTCAQPYFAQLRRTPYPSAKQTIRLVSFTAAYPHKSLDLIPQVAWELKRRWPERRFEFVLTLPADDPTWESLLREAHRLGVETMLVNRGPQPTAAGPTLYKHCHLAFIPTVLECFTANYPEAMAMGLPIITSDLDFARSVCGEAAQYFAARDASSAADAIIQVLTSPRLWLDLVERGRNQLRLFPTPRQKYDMYRLLIQAVAARQTFEDTALRACLTNSSSRAA